MKASIIVPAYQAEATLAKCLDSLRAQSLADIEIIVIDDGSADRTGDIADQAARDDTRIRVIHQSNQGVSAARNAGIALTTGEYIAFADADDTLPPDALASLVAIADAEEADLVTGDYADAHTTHTLPPDISRAQMLSALVRCDGRYNAVWAHLYRRAFVLAHGLALPVGIRIGEDVLLNLAAVLAAKRIAHAPQVVYHYLEQPGSAMARSKSGAMAAHAPMLDAMDELLRAHRVKAAHYRDFIELHAGLRHRDGQHTLTKDDLRRIHRGVSPLALPMRQLPLWGMAVLGLGGPLCKRIQQGM